MDALDRRIVNLLQDGLPVVSRPYAEAAARLGIDEDTLCERIQAMLDAGDLTRFGPMYHAERLGGALTLAAMQVPAERFEEVAEQVNRFPEVAHNYAREHRLNMWFVLATDDPGRIERVIDEIERSTGCRVYNMPKEEEFFLELKLPA
ncbi:MAG: Lrp/AsnC family transcriptional regulator [Gammaproteobacteria bacterium]|nr:Lrp/AsnC family transcriptional regulator [Gammaproteobacteria bacterium]NIR98587.1 Lrp/AsnC family transcriptional regulator [Gammaproteobacteria bacterium]NIT64310.1 Lrp/AsnC family transcriptional regulator [Gammaproteobacteria bacterium]NIV21234.1 AsnC family transcriptional regulator [Gammaproteobacteria bacterium]NIX10938.1 AsnC family transcriptional regulator [Gammaproteobacteria bacterium]